MKKHRFTLLLLCAILMGSLGCAAFRPKTASEPTTRRVTTTVIQTGSNIGRRIEVADSSEEGAANEEA